MTNFDNLLVHPATKRQLNVFFKNPSHALLIVGVVGSGKKTLANALAGELLGVIDSLLANHPYFIKLQRPEGKQEIPIEAVRQLISSLNLKVAGHKKGAIDRVVLIADAQDLSEEAQNALLKLLEEPNPGTLFILTAPSSEAILPTVASRAQKIQALAVDIKSAKAYYNGKYTDGEVENAWQLSQGGAGLLNALLNEDKGHPLRKSIAQAKDFLRKDTYGRLIMLDELASNKADFSLTLDALARVLTALHHGAINRVNKVQADKILVSRQLVSSCVEALDKNTSARLIGLNLALNISV